MISLKFIVRKPFHMNILLTVLLLAFSVTTMDGQKKAASPFKNPRIEKTINSHWTFNYFPDDKADRGYEPARYNDSKWPAISIPHTWSTYETTGEEHPFIKSPAEKDNPYWWTGWGWYRKHFTINQEFTGKKVFVEFEGVQKYCKVWINGKYLGDHKGGYGSFDFDITPNIIEGKDNVLVVAVNNQQKDQFRIPPMAAGNFNVYGGIYRDVTIAIKDKLYIPMQGSASHEGGTFITTPEVSEKEGIVRVQTWVKNDYSQAKLCLLNTYIIDAAGKVIQVLKAKYTINPGQLYKFDQTSKPVKNPNLWSPENPYLYKIYSEVTDGINVTDGYTSPLGFRWFRWDYKENFLYVNGKKEVIHGGNRHQEYPWLGDAIPKWITEMDFEDIGKNLNYNFMRTAHYPNDKIVYDLADKLGIIINEESPSIKNQDFSPEVQEQQMKEMIRRDRNHPSIMIWSMGNETDHAVDSKYAVAEDTTRILTARRVTGGSEGKYVKHTDENLSIENLLRCTIRGWYNKDVKDMEPSDSQQSGTEEHQQNMLKASGSFGTGNLCTWLYEDHGADREYLNSPLLHVNPKGYVDVYRVPKYAYYFWQATYLGKPMVFIQPHYWRSQYLGQKKDIVVNSNCDKVELKVNGASKGVKIPDQSNYHSVTFENITIESGTISVTGTKEGKTVTSQVVMAGEPARIILKASHQKVAADRASVAIITADIVDSKGNHVYGANNTIRWSVAGPAALAGPSRYESDINKHHDMVGVWYMDMPVSNVIRSTGKPGTIRITVSASGLASGSVEIVATENKPDNSFVIEPELENEGREPVDKETLSSERLEEIPQEIRLMQDELILPPADKPAYSRAIREYIYKNNPSVDTASVEFRELLKLFTMQLINNNGRLIADDYNFNAGHFNLCRLISGYINATKLPPLFKETLKNYYAEAIIKQGSDKDAGDEMNWLNWIPSGGTVIISQEGNTPAWPKGTIVTSKSELADLIAAAYPVFVNYSDEAKERALTFTSKMNPYIIVNEVNEQSREGDQEKITRILYTAENGKPILIPLIKFISE
jgi:beta-galactosidase